MALGPFSICHIGHEGVVFQSTLGPFRPESQTEVAWSLAAKKNSVFFADLMEGWNSDASIGNAKGLRIDSFDRDYQSGFNSSGG